MEYFIGGYFGAGGNQFSPEKHGEPKIGESFAVDDLLDFSNADAIMSDGFFENATGDYKNSSTVAVRVDSGNSMSSGSIVPCAFTGNDSQFSGGELFVPYDDIAELEWLSNVVEDSFSAEEEIKTLKLLSGGATVSSTTATKPQFPEPSSSSDNTSFLHMETQLPGKVRSKRSRIAPGDWSTGLLHRVTPPKSNNNNSIRNSLSPSVSFLNNVDRKCTHCGAEKTPQWRSGPMGPKTLCNACGVRFKSGRLVAEYRPATSPTFVSTKHSNSHRKVMELRRQKEIQLNHHQQQQQHQHFITQTSVFNIPNHGDDYFIHHGL